MTTPGTFYAGKKVLVTGGLGFIGSNLALELVASGAEVTVVDSLIPQYGGNLHNLHGHEASLRINISDVRDSHSFSQLIGGQDVLFNLAGQTSHLDSMKDPFTDLDINSRAQLSILEVCRQRNPDVKIVFASTRQIYGKPAYLPVDENHLLHPVDVNGINKMSGEWYHILYNNVYGLRSCSLRLTNTIGPRMRIKDARQTFVGIWVKRLLENQPFEIWGGEQLRDFTYVDDAVQAFLLAGAREESNGGIFNLGGSAPITLLELGKALVEVNGGGNFLTKEFPPERKAIDIGDYYSEFTKITRTLGWTPATGLRDALSRTLDYYRKHGAAYI